MKRMLLLAAALALMTLACFEEESPPAPKQFEPSSPVNVLKNVEISFNQRDINLLSAMLSENFVFHFDPRDVGRSPPGGSQYVIPESWTRAEFLRAVTNMFGKAYSISLSIETDNVGQPRPEETEYLAENVPVELLAMLNELDGYITYGTSTFDFERYLAEGGGKYWRLTEWQDGSRYHDEAPAALRPATLGTVLAVFYVI
ncbi:MAG: hypothetical protein V3W11_07610 [bacterium]